MSSPTKDLSAFVAAIDGHGIPASVADSVSQHVLEVLAGAYAGLDVEEAMSVAALGPGDEAARCGKFAMLCHAAESDPTHAATTLCAGLIAVPPALLLSPDGKTAVASVLAGYEVAIRIGEALGSAGLLAKGWWPTAVVGGAGAAAAAGRARHLTPEETQHAIALALVQAGGLGTGGPQAPESRNLLAANTIRIGVEAAGAAARGVSGPTEPLSGERGFLSAFDIEPAPERLLKGLGETWKITETSVKAFPCALQAQSALSVLQSLVEEHAIAASEVRSVEVGLPEAMHRIVDRPESPQSRFAAAASLQHLAAVCLTNGEVAPGRLAANDPEIAALAKRVDVRHDTDLDPLFPKQWPARVRVVTNDGDHAGEASNPPGHPDRPLGLDTSVERFLTFSSARLGPSRQDGIVAAAEALGAQSDLAPLTDPIRAMLAR